MQVAVMASFSWSRWLRSLYRPKTRTYRRPRPQPLALETLETRLAPATYIWTGAQNNHWSVPGNWLVNGQVATVAPGQTPGTLDDLVFPAGPTQLAMVNDLGTDQTPVTFDSLAFSGNNYSLTGNTIILGSADVLGSGSLSVNAGLNNESIGLDGLQLGDSATDRQFFNIDSNSQLTLNSPLIGTTGATLAKDLPGILVLTKDNSQFTGPVSVDANGGILQITNVKALGDGSNSTTVQANGQLQVAIPDLNPAQPQQINEPLILNGSGINNDGALRNVLGTQAVWAASVTLDSDASIGADGVPLTAKATVLTISGTISDGGAGHSVTKEGTGTVIFASANGYRGQTIINNGILQIQNGASLGISDGTAATGTIVNEIATSSGSVSAAGTLQLDFVKGSLLSTDPNGILQNPSLPFDATTNPFVGFQVPNVLITLNGGGFGTTNAGTNAGGIGALDNANGLNVWTGNIILGSVSPSGQNASIGADATTDISTLTVTGIVSEPNAPANNPYTFHKVGTSLVTLTQPDTYNGKTFVDAGILAIQDSQALGTSPLTTVANGATLELTTDGKFQADSLSGKTNQLWVSEPLLLTGTGLGNLGALYSKSGVNTYSGTITLTGPVGKITNTAIGVGPDPNTAPDTSYFPTYNSSGDAISGDFSLTANGGIFGSALITTPPFSPPGTIGTQLNKVGTGQLILPTANDGFTGNIDIQHGWITVENNDSLGAHIKGVGDTMQATVTVENTASLHLDGVGGAINIAQNLVLAGMGFKHNFDSISQMGAVENINGINTISGNVTLRGQVGIGVENVFGPSDLTLTGQTNEKKQAASGGNTITLNANASGGATESDNVIDTGSTSGSITVNYNMYYIPDQLDIYYGVFGSGGINIYSTGGPVSGSATVNVNYGPIGSFTSTFITIVMNQGGGTSGTAWTYTATINPSASGGTAGVGAGGITKLGSQKLNLEGDGTYTGAVDVYEGVLRAQNNTALGAGTAATNVTTVEAAHADIQTITLNSNVAVNTQFALAFGNITTETITYTGVSSGSNSDANAIQTALQAALDAASINGTVTVTEAPGISGGTVFTVTFGGALIGFDQPDLALAPAPAVQPPDPGDFSFASVQDGATGGALELGSAIPQNNGGLVVGSGIVAGISVPVGEHLILAGNGITDPNAADFGDAALTVLPNTDQLWAGPVTLNTSVGIQVASSSQLQINGAIDDASVASPSGAGITFTGGGMLQLGGANTFRGTMNVNAGILTLANGSALGGTGLADIQTITINQAAFTSNDQFALQFGSVTTGTITLTGVSTGPGSDANAIQSALQAALSAAGIDGVVSVTEAVGTTSTVFTVTFGGNLIGFDQPELALASSPAVSDPTDFTFAVVQDGAGGTIVASGAGLRLQGNITVGGEPLIVQGTGVANSPTSVPQWFNVGPAPIQGVNIQDPSSPPEAAAGLVSSIAVDPIDPNVIYIATEGGGAWKTINGGQTWTPIFQTGAALYGGAIAVAPTDPTTIYYGTGETFKNFNAPPPALGFAGTGVYVSHDSGRTWALLTGINPQNPSGTKIPINPMNGLAVSKIIVDPTNANRIWVATGDQATNGQQAILAANPNASITPTAGVWRFDGAGWFNMTALTSVARTPGSPTSKTGAPGTPGPDDDYRMFFPQSNVTWSDLGYDPVYGDLYAALGTEYWSAGGSVIGDPNNAVYYSLNPTSSSPVWFVGNEAVDGESGSEFPAGANQTQPYENGNIKFTVYDDRKLSPLVPFTPAPGNAVIYAAITDGLPNPYPIGPNDTFLSIQVSTNGGIKWAAVKNEPPTNYLGSQGDYDSTILSPDGTNLYVAGVAGLGGLGQVYWSATGGNSNDWKDISIDSNKNGPHTDHHALVLDGMQLDPRTLLPLASLPTTPILDGNDGGIWTLSQPAHVWGDLNTAGQFSTLIEGVTTDPNNPNRIFAGIQDNGTALYLGPTQGWIEANAGDGGEPQIDPLNPQNVYTTVDGVLYKSTTGGTTTASFTQLPAPPGGFSYIGSGTNLYFPYFLDPVNSNRLIVGGDIIDKNGFLVGPAVQESINGGNNWIEWVPPNTLATVSALGVAEYQGNFAFDPGFATVTDKGANTDDTGTVYISDGTTLFVTKNHGTTWVNRTKGIPAIVTSTGSIAAIAVDPTNRDHAFVISSAPPGTGGKRVFQTQNAGQSWSDITGNLPDVSVWSVVFDPRTGFVYVGTDQGVYESNGSGQWQLFGIGMGGVRVTSLDLNMNLNVLTAGTFGQGVYQVTLSNNIQPNEGAIVAASGTAVWTGHVQLAGPTSLGAEDTATVEKGIPGPQLNIVGPISDLILGTTTNTLSKVGPGNVILSGSNSYSGLTDVVTGSLIVHNPNALGANPNSTIPGLGTVVENGAALKLQSSVNGEPLTINGNGPGQLNGHNTGALENISGTNTYSGLITLGNNSTVGVDSGSSLAVTGTISGSFSLIKELTGTLILDPAAGTDNSYTGGTSINQGAINIQTPNALGASGTTTKVLDGAQLQLQGGVAVTAENLRISGTGISGTGALEGVGGANTWGGSVTLAQDPGQNPTTNPPINIGIGALYTNSSDNLLITGTISQVSPYLGINKLGAGTLILNNPNNTYQGATLITNGALRVQSNGALGTPGTSSQQAVIVSPPPQGSGTSGSFTLSFGGTPTPSIPVGSTGNFVQTQLNNLPTIANVGGSVSVTQVSGANGSVVYQIAFGGTLGGGNPLPLGVTASGGASAIVTSNGTFVQSGGALEVDGDPIGFGNSLTVSGEGVTLNGTGAPEVQQVTITGAPSAGFTLGFNGKNTSTLPIGASPNQVATALNGLTTIGGVGGGVTVTSQATTGVGGVITTVYTIILGGTLASGHQPLMAASATGTGTTPPVVIIARDGGSGALHNITGNNFWTGPIVLQSTDSIGVDPATQLAVSGSVQDPSTAPVPPATLTKVGAGDLVFSTDNPYTGLTQVNAGILEVQASTAAATSTSVQQSPLGGVVSEVQTVTLSGPNTGTFNLGFRGQTISPNLSFTTTGSQLATALGNLSTIGTTNGVPNVAVVRTGNTFTITFQGPLAGQALPQLSGNGQLGVTLQIAITQEGSQGTVVNSGGTLRISNSSTISSENLTLSGTGAAEVQQVVLSDTTPTDTFSLTFNNQSTAFLAPNAGAPAVQAALNGLTSIGPSGFVTVFQTPLSGAIAYTIVFGGNLGSGQQPLIGVTQNQLIDPGPPPVFNPVTFSASEILAGGRGALDSSSGNNTWTGANSASPTITLAGNTTIGSDTDQTSTISTLTLNTAINQSVANSSLTKVGTGILELAGTTSNTYSGVTNVNGGTLELDKTQPVSGSPIVAVPAALNIGNNTGGLLSDVVQYEGNDQLAAGAAVTVNSDGLLDLNGSFQDSGNAIGKLTMNGGTVQLTGSASQLSVGGNVTAASDSNGNPAQITNVGTLALLGSSPTITVNGPGVQAPTPDMVIATPITTSINAFTKLGGGVLQLTGSSPNLDATVSKGAVLADATSGATLLDVVLSGGTLGGNGSVNSVQPSNGGSGTIQPGDSNSSPGTLTTNTGNTQSWSSSTTYSVVLNDDLSTSDYSSMTVNGNLALNNATLAGFVGPGVNIGDTFVILNSTNGGIITSQFASVGTDINGLPYVFVGGQKFDVTYVDTGSGVTQVVITPVKQNATITLSSSTGASATSVFGQDVTFTATVTPEKGAGAIPATDSVAFELDGDSSLMYTALLTWNAAKGYATASFPVSFFGPPTSPLSVGQHTVTALFNGDNSFQATDPSNPATLTQTVNKANTTLAITLTPTPPTNPIPGQAVTVTATISPVKPGAGVPTNPDTATFTLDGKTYVGAGTDSQGNVTLTAAGQAILVIPNLSTGLHRLRAAFPGDSDFNPIASTTDTLINVQKGTATMLVFGNPLSSFYGQAVIFTANMSGPVPVGGTVTFYNYDTGVLNQSTLIGTSTLVSGSANSPAISTLSAGTHKIVAVYSGNVSYLGSDNHLSPFLYTVNQDQTQTTLSATPSSGSVALGSPITLAATVSLSGPGVGTPTGIVNFYLDGSTTPFGTAALNGSATNDVAVLATTNLKQGQHTITATYSGTPNFASSTSGGLAENVEVGTSVTGSSSAPSPVYGQTITLTASVKVQPPGVGTVPDGDLVTFTDNGLPLPNATTMAGIATLVINTNNLATGANKIQVNYQGDSSYLTSTSQFTLTVQRDATTTKVSDGLTSNPVYGQTFTITASVTANGPGSGTPTGTVNFYDGVTTKPLGSGTLSGGTATLPISSLGGGTHSILAQYGADTNFSASSGTLVLTVSPAQTQTTLSESATSSTTGSAIYSELVTLTATVSATGGGTPTGTVTFLDGGTTIALGTLSGGIAVSSPVKLSVGTHSNITARYGPTANFGFSQSSPTTITVTAAPTQTQLSATPSPSALGQNVTVTATVTAPSPATALPSGTVTFSLGSTTFNSTLSVVNGNAIATWTIAGNLLSFGANTINATYNQTNSNTNFLSSPGSMIQEVLYNDTTKLSASTSNAAPATSSIYGQTVTLTAVVTTASSSSGLAIPSGGVNFFDGKTLLNSGGPVAFTSSSVGTATATFPYSGLPVTTLAHSLTAVYAPDSASQFVPSTSSALSFTVTKASTTVTTPVADNSAPTYGTFITLTTTVMPVAPGGGTPTGTVTFTDLFNGKSSSLGNGSVGAGGVATLMVNTINVGTNTITATYNGDSNFKASGQSGSVTVTPVQTTSNVLLSSSVDTTAPTLTTQGSGTAVFSQAVTLTVAVSNAAPGGGGIATGNVIFIVDGSTILGPSSGVPLKNGVATLVTSTLSLLASPGHQVTATYLGDNNFASGQTGVDGADNIIVNEAGTTTTVSSSAPIAGIGQLVTLTATVAGASPATGSPTSGQVTFFDNGNQIGSPVNVNSKGIATLVTSFSSIGTHPLTASYGGDGIDFLSSPLSNDFNQVVQQQVISKLVGSVSPAQPGFGKAFTITLLAEDSHGNLINNYNQNVSIIQILLNGVTAPSGALQGATTVQFKNGKAIFTLTIPSNKYAGTFKLLFASGGITSQFSFATIGRNT
jgi:autotransporter-associated beta strand protein